MYGSSKRNYGVFNNYTFFCFYLRQITIVQSAELIE